MSKNNFEDELFGDLDIKQEVQQTPVPPPALTEVPGFKTLSNTSLDTLTGPVSLKQSQSSSIKSALKEPPPALPIKWIISGVVLLVAVGVGGMYAMGFFSTEQPRPVKNRPSPRTVRQLLYLQSKPKGATIWVNGRPYAEKTPANLILLPDRSYKFVLKLKGYKDSLKLYKTRVVPLAPLRWMMELKPDKQKPTDKPTQRVLQNGAGWVKVKCVPVGARVKLGLLAEVKCPSQHEIDGGTHPLRVEADGYVSYSGSLTVKPGEVKDVVIELKKLTGRALRAWKRKQRMEARKRATPKRRRVARRRPRGKGEVTIACPESASVYWRGRKIGKTPLTFKFPAGTQKIELRGSKGKRRSIRLVVKAKTKLKKSYAFRFGKIKFQIKPWADVWINGKKIGQTPIPPHKVKEGVYSVLLKMKDQSERKRIRVKGNQTSYVFHYFQ